MRTVLRNSFFTLLTIAILASCAKSPDKLEYNVLEQASLDAWMAKYVPDATKQPNGMYTKVLTAVSGETPKPVGGGWVEIRFTGYSMPDSLMKLPGNVFTTRDSLIAAHEGITGVYRTHYAPKKVFMSLYDGILTEAMYQTLIMMKVGEKWAFWAPSSLMFGASGSAYNYGYQGQKALAPSVTCYMEIELVNVIDDVEADEVQQVQDYALANLGQIATDSIKQNFYLKTLPNDPEADSVRVDSTAKIYYVKRFLDGTVYETNIDSIAQRVFKDYSTHTPITYKPSTYQSSYIEAFYVAITHMKYNSWGKFVFTSAYGYGYSGITDPSQYDDAKGPEIDPFTPLYFEIFIPAYEP